MSKKTSVKIYEDLIGVTFFKVVKSNNISSSQDELIFYHSAHSGYKFTHFQDCCEYVYIQDICGDLADLERSPILEAEEISERKDDMTWTFYKFKTKKGSVTVRWCGESNGYYSEEVNCYKFTTNLEPISGKSV